MKHQVIAMLMVALATAPWAIGQEAKTRNQNQRNYPPQMKGVKSEIYKTVGDVELKIYIFEPPQHKPTDERAAIVFFFGGGWTGGSPQQFEHQCRYLASRGLVALTADYRVRSRHGVKVPQCIADAKSAVRWVRSNARRLGIDPDRIAAGGGSAGGHLAAATGLIQGFDEANEDLSISSVPNAMVLFNPAAALAPFEGSPALDAQRAQSLQERIGKDPEAVSPAHHVRANAPPTIIYFGTDDRLLKGAQYMQERMKAAKNRCQLLTWEGLPHGFFNWARFDNKPFIETMRATDEFLVSLGYLQGEPTIDEYPTPRSTSARKR
jgi:acetyl esterase/lipase